MDMTRSTKYCAWSLSHRDRRPCMSACRACRVTSPSSLPRAYLIGRPAVCCGVVLPVCPCVVSFSKDHKHVRHARLAADILSRILAKMSGGCYEKSASVEFKLSLARVGAVKLEFHGTCFLVASSWHPRKDLARKRVPWNLILTR